MRNLFLGIAALAISFNGRSASAVPPAPLNRPLKSSQVACAERQLGRVQRRMAAYGSGLRQSGDGGLNPGGSLLALSHTTLGGGIFSGRARILDLGPSSCADFQAGTSHFSEADLAFELLFKERTDLLDPGHPRIPQATLVRRDGGTNFGIDRPDCSTRVLPDLTCPIVLSLDLAAQANDQLLPGIPIYLNSTNAVALGSTGPGARPREAATGRGPGILNDSLSSACGGVLSDFDQRVFEILARTIVPSDAFLTLAPPRPCDGVPLPFGYTLAIFRGADPRTYRVNVYDYESSAPEDAGPNDHANGLALAVELKMSWDAAGRLTTGTARVLPLCRDGQDLDCTGRTGGLGLVFVPPIFPGHEEEPPAAFHQAPYLNFTGGPSAANVLATTIDWTDLLKNTALNTP